MGSTTDLIVNWTACFEEWASLVRTNLWSSSHFINFANLILDSLATSDFYFVTISPLRKMLQSDSKCCVTEIFDFNQAFLFRNGLHYQHGHCKKRPLLFKQTTGKTISIQKIKLCKIKLCKMICVDLFNSQVSLTPYLCNNFHYHYPQSSTAWDGNKINLLRTVCIRERKTQDPIQFDRINEHSHHEIENAISQRIQLRSDYQPWKSSGILHRLWSPLSLPAWL